MDTMKKYALLICLSLLLGSCAAHQGQPVDNLILANRLYEQGVYPQALELYLQLVRSAPKDGELWFKLANCYTRTGQAEAAIEAYRNALLREPTMGKAWYNLGQVHLNMALKAYIDAQQYMRADDPARELIAVRHQQLFSLLQLEQSGEQEAKQ